MTTFIKIYLQLYKLYFVYLLKQTYNTMGIIKNAIIESATITAESGYLTAHLHLDYGGMGQIFGWDSLYLSKGVRNEDLKIDFTGHFLFMCLKIADVHEFSQLKGKCIRVLIENENIKAIGHIVNDDWFCPSIDFESIKEEQRSSKQLSETPKSA